MKKIFYLIALIGAIAFTSCDKEDDMSYFGPDTVTRFQYTFMDSIDVLEVNFAEDKVTIVDTTHVTIPLYGYGTVDEPEMYYLSQVTYTSEDGRSSYHQFWIARPNTYEPQSEDAELVALVKSFSHQMEIVRNSKFYFFNWNGFGTNYEASIPSRTLGDSDSASPKGWE